MDKYNVYGVNSMGSTWYLADKNSSECSLWSGAPREMRAVFDSLEEAQAKVEELNESYKFASTRHHVCKA